MVLFDLIAFNRPWGRWGLGPVMLAPTASHVEPGTAEMSVSYDWNKSGWSALANSWGYGSSLLWRPSNECG